MITTIIRGDAQKQEVWKVSLVDTYTSLFLSLDGYRIETKKPGQRKRRIQEEWDRHDPRGKALPPLPDDVVAEAKEHFIAQIRGLVIQRLDK